MVVARPLINQTILVIKKNLGSSTLQMSSCVGIPTCSECGRIKAEHQQNQVQTKLNHHWTALEAQNLIETSFGRLHFVGTDNIVSSNVIRMWHGSHAFVVAEFRCCY